jgi:hypothetical protein
MFCVVGCDCREVFTDDMTGIANDQGGYAGA